MLKPEHIEKNAISVIILYSVGVLFLMGTVLMLSGFVYSDNGFLLFWGSLIFGMIFITLGFIKKDVHYTRKMIEKLYSVKREEVMNKSKIEKK